MSYIYGAVFVGLHIVFIVILQGLENIYLKELFSMLSSFSILIPFLLLIKSIPTKVGANYWINYLAKNTIIILACHTYMIRIFEVLVYNILQLGGDFFDGRYLLKFAMALSIMLLMLIPIYLINRFTPFIIGRGKLFDK